MKNARVAILLLLFASLGLAIGPVVPEGGQVVAEKKRVLQGKEYTFTKVLTKTQEVKTFVSTAPGRSRRRQRKRRERTIVGEKLSALLKQTSRRGDVGQAFRVNIALNLDETVSRESPRSGEAEISDGVTIGSKLDGREVSDAQVEEQANRTTRSRQRSLLAAKDSRNASLKRFAARHRLADRREIQTALEEDRDTVTLELTRSQLLALIASKDSTIAGIELYEKGEDDINSAMADTSISTSALLNSSTRGSGVGIFMTENGCANESRFSNYDRLSGSETNHSRNVGGILRTVSPDSFMYCRGGSVLPTFVDLNGALLNSKLGFPFFPVLNPPIQIVTRSNSSNDTTSYNTLDRDWDNFIYSKNIPIFNSGGNTGNGTGNVRSPGKGLNVISVGDYNDANDAISNSSPFVDPNTGNDKPEVVAPGTNISAGGFSFSGTSQATPHAAAFAADMMSSSTYLKYKPYLVKAKLLAGATDSITGGYNKVGLGGVDFASAQWNGYYVWWEGNNGAFTYFAQNDGGTSSTYVEKKIYIGSWWSKTRVVLSWLNRGSYTYDHRNDVHPIGMDLDLRVYDPNGNYVGGSFSWDNSFEKVNLTPTVSGYYTFKINRYANRDTSLNLRMGLYVNYYN